MVEHAFTARIGQELAAIAEQATRRDLVNDTNEAAGAVAAAGVAHFQHLAAARAQLLNDDAHVRFRHVDQYFFERLEDLAMRARCLARDAWQAVDGRGYGRVDLRTDAADTLYVLEVNPNPDLAPAAGLARMAAAAGYDYTTLVDRIVREAAP